MACTLATNLTIGCADETANGGFSKLYLVADADLVSATFGTPPAHTATAITLADSKKFIEFNGRFATKSLASETTKENGGVSITHTLEVFVPKVEKTKAQILQGFMALRGVAGLVETYETTGATKQALLFGFDKKIGKDAFLKATVNQMIEATIDGQNGYMVTFVGMATELSREFIGSITVEDGSTGTSVSFGA